MRIFVTGAAGMLAAEIIRKLEALGHEVIKTDVHLRLEGIRALDITNKDNVLQLVKETRPDYIFHLAAQTNVDLCEQNPEHAFLVNREGTRNIVQACQDLGVRLLYVSTAGVFYGDKKEPYTEEDQPRPKNVYGQSKLEGEWIVQKELSQYFIIRAGWMVGGWEIDKKFVYKIVQQLLEGRTKLRVVADKFGSPTFTSDFADNLMSVINTKQYGLYHMANKGTCSRFDIAVKIVEFMGLQGKIEIEAISSDEFPLPAPRADSEMMRNQKLDQLGLNHMPSWEESLQRYIKSNTCRV